MAGMTRANSPPISVSLATLRIFADHYPECLHRCYFVDAPAIFGLLWAVRVLEALRVYFPLVGNRRMYSRAGKEEEG